MRLIESNRPIFVIGTPRSGTTLMARVLNQHSQIFMPGEMHFFPDIYAQRDKLGDLPGEAAANRVWARLTSLYQRYNEPNDQERVDSILEDDELRRHLWASFDSYQNLLTTFMGVQTECEGKLRWGNNTPKDLFYVEDIIAFYPDAQFIVCLRDIRDFLKSYQGKWKITSDNEAGRLKKLYHPVITSMLWKASMKKVNSIRNKLPEDKLLIVQYEDMVSRPEAIMRKVCEFLGESYESQMLNINFSNSSDKNSQRGIYSGSVGGWKGKLSCEEIWIAQKLAGSEMKAFGYESENIKANYIKLMLLFLSTPWALWSALKANRSKYGPAIPYMLRRIAGLFGHQTKSL